VSVGLASTVTNVLNHVVCGVLVVDVVNDDVGAGLTEGGRDALADPRAAPVTSAFCPLRSL
jgi:hypothetical protein